MFYFNVNSRPPRWIQREKKFERVNKPVLYDRNCAKCNIKIKTPYAPERPEIVYCVKCYQQEVY